MSRITRHEGQAVKKAFQERIKVLKAEGNRTEIALLISAYNKLKDGLRSITKEM